MMADLTLGRRLMQRLDAFARHSDEEGALTRLYLSPAHRRAVDDLTGQMRSLGLEPWLDGIGNVLARYPGLDADAPAIIIGSHIDTVRNAGRYDGALGVFAALGAIEALQQRGERLACPIDLVAFGDEEGVRFPTTLGGSRALAGMFDMASLDARDEDGVSLREALVQFGCDPTRIPALARRPGSVRAFVEMHIEQGPVLEAENLPVGIVAAINGATRLRFALAGMAGHAGTVPMALRRDALAAAAEMVLAVEARGHATPDLVATVGRMEVKPGAVNVIPGDVIFTLDARAPDDATRRRAIEDIIETTRSIAARRGLTLDMSHMHDADATPCDGPVQEAMAMALSDLGIQERRLPSGAGHDAMAMAALCPVGMLFVRCKGGISHHPDESMTVEDAEAAMAVFIATLRHLAG
jgi:allantoate deiminase